MNRIQLASRGGWFGGLRAPVWIGALGWFMAHRAPGARLALAQSKPNDLPVDSHQLIALCAPRRTFISYGIPE